MLDQPINNKNNRHKRYRIRLILVTTDKSVNQYHNNNNIVWPIDSARKAHSSAFALQKNPDCQLIVWLAEIMIYLHKNTTRRARWSGPCGHHSGCRLI